MLACAGVLAENITTSALDLLALPAGAGPCHRDRPSWA